MILACTHHGRALPGTVGGFGYRAYVATRAERSMSFGAIAEDYDRLRSGPPDAAVDWLVPAGCRVAVDLGAGTGLLTRALARKVPRVVAVEPDGRMAAVQRERAADAGLPGIEAVQGTGEQIPLPDASADGVFASSSWHWMDPERAPTEIARVLRDGARLGLIWTSRDRAADWLREIDWFRAAGRAGGTDGGAGQRPRRNREVTLPAGLFGGVEAASFTFTRQMTADEVVGMLATYSGAITAAPEERRAATAHARAVLERRFPGAGRIDVPMRSVCLRAGRRARGVGPD